METPTVDFLLAQLDFDKIQEYVEKFVANLIVYEKRGKVQRKNGLTPKEIQDPQIQSVFFIGAGMYLINEKLKLKGLKRSRCPRQQPVKALLSDLYSGTVPRLLENRPKVVDVKEACLEQSTLKDMLKASSCCRRGDANNCKNALMEILQQRGVPREKETRIEAEIKGLHFYVVYRDLWAALEKSKTLHKNKKKIEDALEACEKAFEKVEEIFQVEKAANRTDQTPAPEQHYQSEIDKQLQRKLDEEKKELIALKEKTSLLEKAAEELTDDLQTLNQEKAALSNEKKRLNDALLERKAKVLKKKEEAEKLQHTAKKDNDKLQDAKKRLEKQIDEMTVQYEFEYNELKADVTAKASDIQRHQQRLNEEAQKHSLAENSQDEHLSEVAKRYDNLSKKACDVAKVLVETGRDEDESNRFIVDMLIASRNAAKLKFADYERNSAEIHGLSEPFLKNNQTAKRTLRESVTCLLRLASATKKKEDSKQITEMAINKVKKKFPKYHVQETASAIEKFLISASPIIWEVALSLRQTDFVLDDKTFDEALHDRFTGSDPEAKNVKFIVWPRLAERFSGKTLCKGKVVTGQ